MEKWLTLLKISYVYKKRVKLNKMGWKCAKLLKMGQILRNGSHLYKQATFKKSSWPYENRLDLKKSVTLEKMGYVFQKRCTLKKLGRFNKVDHIWRRLYSRLKKLIKL